LFSLIYNGTMTVNLDLINWVTRHGFG